MKDDAGAVDVDGVWRGDVDGLRGVSGVGWVVESEAGIRSVRGVCMVQVVACRVK